MNIYYQLERVRNYSEKEQFRGYDPYDALNSPILKALSFNQKYLRIAFTQILRRLPVNLRPVLGIKKDYSPKGMGLFLAGYLKLFKITRDEGYLENARWIIDWLKANRSAEHSGYAWGYNFDWQSRALFVPKGTPTIVNTSFIANAFLDAYEVMGQEEYLDIGRSSCDFILKDLNRWEKEEFLAFSYTPIDHTKVHNANMLGAGLLGRIYSFTGKEIFKSTAKKMVNYVASCQRKNGSWYYSETDYQKWIDSFHTGFILEFLYLYSLYTQDKDFQANLQSGLEFYRQHFFAEEGIPWYYYDHSGPIDIHSAAQGIITFSKFSQFDSKYRQLAERIAGWAIKHMLSPKGYFYYRKRKFKDNKIPYIRWAQAWMFHALTDYLVFIRSSTVLPTRSFLSDAEES